MTFGRALVLAAVLFGPPEMAGAAPANDAPDVWKFTKSIALPSLSGPAFVEVILDAEVFREASPSLADLRVRDRAGAEIGYMLRRHEQAAAQQAHQSSLLDLVTVSGNQTRFSLDLGPKPAIHNGVRLTVADDLKNFRVPVRVETGPDGHRWELARAGGFIYVVEGETRATDTSVSYPTSTARWLRVTVGPAHGRPLPVKSATVVRTTPAERDEEPVAATLIERAEDLKQKTTRLVVNLGVRRPVDRLDLEIADRNFHRVVLIEASDDGRRWRWVGSCAIGAIEIGRVHERQTIVRIPETWPRYLRLLIQNLDDQPLRVSGVRVTGVQRGLVFEPVPGQTYVLHYGNPRAPVPRYDVTRAARYLSVERLPMATLGPAAPLPRPPSTPWFDAQPVLLWGALALAALTLGAVLLRLARQIRASA